VSIGGHWVVVRPLEESLGRHRQATHMCCMGNVKDLGVKRVLGGT